MIALIAHDEKKDDMLAFTRKHVELFKEQTLVATGNTGKLLNSELGIERARGTWTVWWRLDNWRTRRRGHCESRAVLPRSAHCTAS